MLHNGDGWRSIVGVQESSIDVTRLFVVTKEFGKIWRIRKMM